MSDFLIVVKDNALAITTLVGVFTIIGGFIGAHIKNKREKEKYELEKQKIEADKKSVRQQMITNNIAPMRQLWINDVREKASLFLANAVAIQDHEEYTEELQKSHTKEEYEVLENRFYDKIDKNDELYIQLKLLLPFENGDNKEKLAVDTMNSLKLVYDTIGLNNQTKEDIKKNNKKIDDCTEKFKILLKDEWNKTKSLKELD